MLKKHGLELPTLAANGTEANRSEHVNPLFMKVKEIETLTKDSGYISAPQISILVGNINRQKAFFDNELAKEYKRDRDDRFSSEPLKTGGKVDNNIIVLEKEGEAVKKVTDCEVGVTEHGKKLEDLTMLELMAMKNEVDRLYGLEVFDQTVGSELAVQ